MPPERPALGAALDLLPWQAELLGDLAAQMDALRASGVETVPPVALLTIVRYLDEIDLSACLCDSIEAGAILGVTDRHVRDMADVHPAWMTPIVEVRAAGGKVVQRLWLRRKVEAFARIRKSL